MAVKGNEYFLPPAKAGLTGLAFVLSAFGLNCGGSDSENNGTPVQKKDAGEDSPPLPEAAVETAADTPVDTYDPTQREGFNGKFSDSPCPVLDLDIKGNAVTGICGYPGNRKFTMNLNATDPKASTVLNFGSGNAGAIGAEANIDTACVSNAKIYPGQIESVGGDSFAVALNAECDAVSGGTFTKSGVAYINGAKGDETTVSFIKDVTYHSGSSEIIFRPVNMYGAVMAGEKIALPASEALTGNGMILTYDLSAQKYLNYNSVGQIIFTSGKKPVAMAMLDDTYAISLNAQGGQQSWQLSGASLDVVELRSQADGGTSAGVVATIPLGVDFVGTDPADAPPPELAITADKKVAVVNGGNDTNRSKILIVDIEGKRVAGSIDLGNQGKVRGIAVMGTRAFISMDKGENTATSGSVVVVDFSDASNPKIVGSPISVGHDLGAIAVHESGNVFVSVTDRWWETPGSNKTRWSHVVALDPAIAH